MQTKLLLDFTIGSIEMVQWHTGDDHFAISPMGGGNSVNIRWCAQEVRDFIEFLTYTPSGSSMSVSTRSSVQKLVQDDADEESIVLLHFCDDKYQGRGVKLVMTLTERLEFEQAMLDMIRDISALQRGRFLGGERMHKDKYNLIWFRKLPNFDPSWSPELCDLWVRCALACRPSLPQKQARLANFTR
jgi:hypothetical protein